MKVTTTTTHAIEFIVEYCEPTEGGMESDTYGGACLTVEGALNNLIKARQFAPVHDWVIVGYVTTEVS